ncbi:MAG: MBL fold metallo-hydrolase [Breznakibacter sp.]
MKRRDFLNMSGLLGLSLSFPVSLFSRPYGKAVEESPVNGTDLFLPDMDELRKLSGVVPGALPQKINVTKVADTIRPASVVVKGESPDRKMTLSRSVYQLVYPQGTVMLDSGMDLETHRTFGKTEEPYYPENFNQVEQALGGASLIVLTHYHADHSAGVIRSEKFDDLAHKVWVSNDTADLLVDHPHKPTVAIDREKVNRFIVTDFEKYYPLTPGVVIFKTPGHTPDSKMLYIRLENGREFIHSVDSGWSMENIVKERMKNASWVSENETQLMAQYKWLNRIMKTERNVTVLCAHDNEQYNELTEKGILGKGLII